MFGRKKQTQPEPPQPAEPHVVEDMLHLERKPPISRVVWSDGHIDYVKPGESIPKR
jgi:hypothetical protein